MLAGVDDAYQIMNHNGETSHDDEKIQVDTLDAIRRSRKRRLIC